MLAHLIDGFRQHYTAACTASSMEKHGKPRGVFTLYLRSISLPGIHEYS
jgi:hypothetical protein